MSWKRLDLGIGLGVTVGLLLATGALADPCSVPGDHASLSEAVADVDCDPITLGVGEFPASVPIGRSVSIVGAGSGVSLLCGAVDEPVIAVQSPAAVTLEGLGLLASPDSLLTSAALTQEVGASLSMVDVTVGVDVCGFDGIFRDGFESGDTTAWSP
ncbi:MAG: hypothetical protein K8J08_16710 [Thermoanaerobaculia bacterium]|nr:hypothetical protein [Thermoanaerobaculia bacterium]